MLAGKCRHCRAGISWRYPLLELLMGLSWGVLAWHYGASPILLQALCLFFLLWVLTFIDLETGLLPNALTFPGITLGLGFSLWMGDWQASLIGAVVGYSVFWLVARLFLLITGREGMGYGDFKLLAMLGGVHGLAGFALYYFCFFFNWRLGWQSVFYCWPDAELIQRFHLAPIWRWRAWSGLSGQSCSGLVFRAFESQFPVKPRLIGSDWRYWQR